jgi:orotate phosphoribosyltransferase
MTPHEQLVEMLATRSARLGSFILASGQKSNLYIDARLTTMSPDGMATIGPLALAALRETGWRADAVGGLTMGADPVSCAIAYASALAGTPLRAFTVRKEAKTHGTGKLIEGPFHAGDLVVVVEDTITTGGSALKAIGAVRAEGGEVLGVLAVVDREEGGRATLNAAGIAVVALTRAAEILKQMPGPLGGPRPY